MKLINTFLQILLIVLLALDINQAQQKTAVYQDMSLNLFSSYKQPIGIGILKFEGSNDLDKILYEELKSQPGIHEKFTIFPYEIIVQQKGALGIKGEISATDLETLRLLKNNLDIELVVCGSVLSNDRFILKICNTANGQEEYYCEFEKSKNSSAINDAVRLISEDKTTNYDICPQSITDARDGKVYETVLIGAQCWLKKNMNIGTRIDGSYNQASGNGIEKYCYDNIETNCNTYGGLYQWDEAMQYIIKLRAQGICPPGWHIPTLAEFQTLSDAVGGNGNALLAIGQGGGTNSSGFVALLAGFLGGGGYFVELGRTANFWRSSAYDVDITTGNLTLFNHLSIVAFNGAYGKQVGFSVRCLKD